jgi:N-acetylglutamate synthase-like GNAT family acetyltransferase
MTHLHFENLTTVKLPLVQRFYKNHYPAAKANKSETIIVGYINGSICCAVRFRKIEQYQLLTGMAVDSTMRHQGIGSSLLAYCQRTILTHDVYCFALTSLDFFYQRYGFTIINPDQLPNSLKMLYQSYTRSGKALTPMQFN